MANDILSLLQESGYYGAGGRDPGQRDVDKISSIGSSLGGAGKSLMDYVTLREAMKKAELERQKLKQENMPLVNIVGGQTPVQTQANVNQVMKQPIPAQDLISGRLDTTQQGLEDIGRSVKQGQDIYDKYGTANVEQAQKIANTRFYDPKTALTEAQTEKALRKPDAKPNPQLISKSEFLKRRKTGEQIKSTDYKIVDDMQGSGRDDRSTKNLIFRYQTELRREPDYKKASDMIRSADELETLLKNVYDKNGKINEVAFSGAKAKAARAAGEVGVMTDADIARYSQGSSIIRKSSDKLTNLINGKPTDLTIEDMQAVSEAMRLKAEERRLNAANMTADMMAVNLNMSPDEVYKYLALSDISLGKANQPKDKTPKQTGEKPSLNSFWKKD